MKDRSDDLSHHERTLLPRSYISLPCVNCVNHEPYRRQQHPNVVNVPLSSADIFWEVWKIVTRFLIFSAWFVCLVLSFFLSLFSSLFLYSFLFFFLSFCVSFFLLFLYLPFFLSFFLSFCFLLFSFFLSFSLSFFLFLFLSLFLSFCCLSRFV